MSKEVYDTFYLKIKIDIFIKINYNEGEIRYEAI